MWSMLEHLPLFFIIAALIAYAVLAGADFGAGIWILISRPTDAELRDHARHSMGPVWEANHVWLIFILVVSWTAYPRALSSITSTLAVPLTFALIGIVLRGSAYALRAQAEDGDLALTIERVFGVSSVLTPFALGTAVGGIASGRVPVGNAAGNLITSWANPIGIVIGALSVTTSWYLASVYLTADAQRTSPASLIHAFRLRALGAGSAAGVLALVALVVVHADAPRLWHGLTHGAGIAALLLSGFAGASTLTLVWARRYELARVASAVAVAAVVGGWAIAQRPYLLPGLTVREAAAGHATLVALVVAMLAGAVVLVPSLALLFTMTLRGRFDADRPLIAAVVSPGSETSRTSARVAAATAALAVGSGCTVLLDAWGLAIGVVLLLAFILLGFGPLASPPD
jgi:cytochrome bd-type quinol oxidase subunit 2